jgi:uncharacterized protein YcbK (DUF882 family)
MHGKTLLGRREALRLGGGALLASGLAMPSMGWASTLSEGPRRATLLNLHTGDRFNEVYFEGGRYVPDALAEAMKVMRDWRNGEQHYIDPKLFDALHTINGRLETNQPFQIISGYRSPKTNAAMHAKSSGVASNSQHTQGKAIDVRVAGVDLRNLHKAALNVSAGGVGFYPQSNFVHVDVARVRQWTGV